ncbi:hypothetical protein PkP19E3_16270 [Pseudomonas koreensis]|nr:hypothetical protein PkP19E3_16270 [Pseudomonas koreensis]
MSALCVGSIAVEATLASSDVRQKRGEELKDGACQPTTIPSQPRKKQGMILLLSSRSTGKTHLKEVHR